MLSGALVLSAFAYRPSADVAASAQSLDGNWIASSSSLRLRLTGTVPGDLISDLHKGGFIPDPWWENNFLNGSLWNAPDWVYSKNFAVDPELIASGVSIFLVFDSVKMGASVSLGGVELGQTTDMFIRYTFNVTDMLRGGMATLKVAFDPSIETHGYFTASTGGWDWAPWSHTWDDNFSPTFSKGLVGSVYLLPVRSSLLTDVTVHTYYRGAHATAPLSDGEHAGFEARIRAHVTASSPLRGVLTVHGAWSSTPATRVVSLAPGAQVVTHNITVGAKEIQLWWPNGAGAHALYQVDVVGRPAVTRSRERRIAQPRAPRARRCADWHTYAAPPHAPPQTLDLLPAACAEGRYRAGPPREAGGRRARTLPERVALQDAGARELLPRRCDTVRPMATSCR